MRLLGCAYVLNDGEVKFDDAALSRFPSEELAVFIDGDTIKLVDVDAVEIAQGDDDE